MPGKPLLCRAPKAFSPRLAWLTPGPSDLHSHSCHQAGVSGHGTQTLSGGGSKASCGSPQGRPARAAHSQQPCSPRSSTLARPLPSAARGTSTVKSCEAQGAPQPRGPAGVGHSPCSRLGSLQDCNLEYSRSRAHVLAHSQQVLS